MGLDRFPHRPAAGHRHFWERAVSRRDALLGAAAMAGAAAGARLLPPFSLAPALAAGGADPRPIPGGLLVLDGRRVIHAYPPGPSNPADPASPINEPSTITDFDGVVAITQTQGRGTAVEHGVELPVLFDSDMRFITGRYVGTDGQVHEGSFGFVWLDIYVSQVGSVPGFGAQLHDYSPGVAENGLFWTIPAPEAVQFDHYLQTGLYRVTELAVLDGFILANSAAGGPTIPAKVSFEVEWTATGPAKPVRNQAQGFTGEFRNARATVAWSSSTGDSRFVSQAAGTSTTVFAVIGRERNGVFLS